MATKPTKAQVAQTKANVTGDSANVAKNVIEATVNAGTPAAQAMAADMFEAGVVDDAGTSDDGVQLYSVDPGRISELGDFVMRYDPQYNPFVSTMLNRIFATTVNTLEFEDPFHAKFNKGFMEYGDTVEEAWIDLPRTQRYSPRVAESEVFKRERPDVHAAFHTLNAQLFWKTTLENSTLRQAFVSANAFGDFVSRQIRTLTVGRNYVTWNLYKYTIGRAILNGWVKPYQIDALPTNEGTSRAFLAVLQQENLNFDQPSREYNLAGVVNRAPIEEQAFIQTNSNFAQVNVQGLAALFNQQFADYRTSDRLALTSFADMDWDALDEVFTNPETGEVDGNYARFTADEQGYLKTVGGVLLDRRWFQMWDNLDDADSIWNPQGRYWNYFQHTWRIISFSPFYNAEVFLTQGGTVSGVTLSPTAVTLAPGARQAFSATVAGTGVASQAVDWSMSGATDPQTALVDGILTLGSMETGTGSGTKTITVTATSRADSSKSGSATVTVA